MLKIGKITLKNNFILAPMAGYTNLPFRALMAENGAGLTVTEMVSVKALLFKDKKTALLLKTSAAEAVKCVQLFGNNPADFAGAVKSELIKPFDIIDINMGCPVKKVFGAGSGCALMGNAATAAAIVNALKSEGKTVTVKTRLGIENGDEVFEFARKIEEAGADLITLHCRTAKQMYSGKPDYSAVKTLKSSLKIPITVNGDILNKESFLLSAETGADGFMIGRGALYNPLIFLELQNRASPIQKDEMIFKLIDLMAAELGKQRAAVELRKFLPYLLKGQMKKSDKHALNFITDSAILKQELRKAFDKI